MGVVTTNRRNVTEGAPVGGLLNRLLVKALRYRRDRSGVTAIEFALVAPVLITVIFGTLESAMMFYVATSMEGEVQIAARQIRTGTVQGSEDPIATFRSLLCNNLETLTNCNSVVIDVRTMPDFGSIDLPPLIDEDGNPENENFEPGDGGEVVLVRIAYRYTILTPFVGDLLGATNGHRDLYAAAAFQNEPYDGPLDDGD
jgi:Flp pilus assembly protein TadG